MSDEVWISHEAWITIWEVNPSTGANVSKIREVNFAQNVSFRPVRLTSQLRQPGVAWEETKTRVIAHEIKIDEFSISKGEQVTPYLQNKQYRVKIEFVNERTGQIDNHEFLFAVPIEGPEVKFTDDNPVEAGLVFRAEKKV